MELCMCCLWNSLISYFIHGVPEMTGDPDQHLLHKISLYGYEAFQIICILREFFRIILTDVFYPNYSPRFCIKN